MSKYKVLSKGIEKIDFLKYHNEIHEVECVVGWGIKPNTKKARAYAVRHGLPYIALEDGFLRSVDLGVNGAQPLSLVVDDVGIYYDSTQPSKLEQLVADVSTDSDLKASALSLMDLITKNNLSKYNHAPDVLLPDSPHGLTHRVLVIDQTFGDMSVLLGGGEQYFAAMLDAALAEHPTAQVIVKTHPDVLSGKKKGYLTDIPALSDPRVLLWAQDSAPLHFLRQVDQVYVYTSQMGFEALLLGKTVHCFGLPWYAGWGVTIDHHPDVVQLALRRPVKKELWQLVAAAYLQYARYIEPDVGQRGTVFDVIPWLVRNKAISQQMKGTIYCIGMSAWKKATIRPFLTTHSARLHFVPSLKKFEHLSLASDAKLLIWGSRDIAAAQAVALAKKVPLWRMEDGFVRSVGLGSDLFRPLSLVVDHSGMYYDPHSNSDLEQLLKLSQWDQAQLQQAQSYSDQFIKNGISKYNLGGSALVVQNQGKSIVLVPGQVEDDASVKYGSPVIKTNADLVRAVRKNCPDAYIIYKPHPDVVAGNRQGTVPDSVLADCVDLVVTNANIVDCLRVADQVHTMTSLTGFEALIHGKAVHCYGGPFYAGWGLTTDHYPLAHRGRQLTLNQLVYATIFQYPRYIMPPNVGVPGFAAPESVLQWIAEQKNDLTNQTVVGGWLARKKRKTMALWQMLMSRY